MNFYQAGYFRQGVQGGNAGWGIVSPSSGMSRIAQEGFKGISANLVELKNREAMPVVNYGIFQYDRFTYLLHVNYAARGEDSRGVVFVHGYCFNSVDYYELCTKPEMLFGIREENFLMEYDAAQEQYPVRNMLSHDAMSFRHLCSKYHFTKEEYRYMILRAINALEGYADPLCIKYNLALDDYLQVSKELVYLIMMGLPYHLRSKLSCFSYSGSRSAVYVCGYAEGNNCIDLDTREFAGADVSRLLYDFTRIYNSFEPYEYEKRERIFKGMADTMNAMFSNPLQDISCSRIENSFEAYLKKTDEILIPGVKGICPETVLELLYGFLKCDLKENEEVYAYLGALLEVVNDSLLHISDQRIVKRLSQGYQKTQDSRYQKEVCRMLARELRLGNRTSGFAELNSLSVESTDQFEMIRQELSQTDKNYLNDYQLNGYLPFQLADMDEIERYLNGKVLPEDEYPCLLNILQRTARKEIENADGFSQLYQIADRTIDLLSGNFPSVMKHRAAQNIREIQFYFWERFDIAMFSPNDINKYETMGVEEIAENGWNGARSENAEKTVKLINLFQKQDKPCDPQQLYDILFTDTILADTEQKEHVQKLLMARKIESFVPEDTTDAELRFDGWLALFYDFKSRRFDTILWAKKFRWSAPNALEPNFINRAVKESCLMKYDNLRKEFQESLAEDIKRAKRDDIDPVIIKGLKRYERCVSGKRLKVDKELESQSRFVDTLCRIPVGSLMLLAIGTLLNMAVRVDEYGIFDQFTVYIAGGTFFVVFVAAAVVKTIYLRDGFSGLLGEAGIKNILRLVIYLLVAVLCLAGVVAILLLNDLKAAVIAAAVYLGIAVMGMAAGETVARD